MKPAAFIVEGCWVSEGFGFVDLRLKACFGCQVQLSRCKRRCDAEGNGGEDTRSLQASRGFRPSGWSPSFTFLNLR